MRLRGREPDFHPGAAADSGRDRGDRAAADCHANGHGTCRAAVARADPGPNGHTGAASVTRALVHASTFPDAFAYTAAFAGAIAHGAAFAYR